MRAVSAIEKVPYTSMRVHWLLTRGEPTFLCIFWTDGPFFAVEVFLSARHGRCEHLPWAVMTLWAHPLHAVCTEEALGTGFFVVPGVVRGEGQRVVTLLDPDWRDGSQRAEELGRRARQHGRLIFAI